MFKKDYFSALLKQFQNVRSDEAIRQASDWLSENWTRVDTLFRNKRVASYVFEPIKELWQDSAPSKDAEIRQLISQIAVANAVMAGLPGKMGIGVAVSIALEVYMAVRIAQRTGIKIDGPADVAKYVGLAAGTALLILEGFRQVLGFFFSLFALVGFLPATAMAELFATSLIGVIFWVGFDEAKATGSFVVPKRLFGTVWKRTKELVRYQWGIVRKGFDKDTYVETARRLKAWMTGDQVFSKVTMRGDIFVWGAFAHLLANQPDQLQEPLSQIFLQAVRDTNSTLESASDQQIAEYFRQNFLHGIGGEVDVEALRGMEALVRGRMFELLVESSEGWDGVGWHDEPMSGKLNEDFNHPGSDIVFTNVQTGDQIEVQIKATDSPAYIEDTLIRYPDIPIIVTSEVGEDFDANELVQASIISNADLEEVTEENFDRMLSEITGAADWAEAAAVGGGAAVLVALWPFVAAYSRSRITQEQFTRAVVEIVPSGGVLLAKRLTFAVLLGPIYAWWVLARGVMSIVPAEDPVTSSKGSRRLVA
ncbi:hypothetical protein CLV78_1264 [Aliiruegeria haliotis]|uniref:Uncharacterized protein n=1 Tax=Aliiruegeria haliotis TaxID=1280846 RepID=A0A2T0RDJ6_9RHOB|nr:hypothetical protein [Aliiruegeria haliotis]PRY19232.1 hypothetical protein CLV78_1264 [Aliiruegeria haliotis]